MLGSMNVVSMLGPCFGSVGMILIARRGSSLLALKKLDIDKVDGKRLADLQQELLLARQLRHPNLLPIEMCFVEGLSLYVVSPVAAYGSCADLVANHFPSGLNEGALSLILRDAIAGLTYLHGCMYLHRAIRGRHILVTGSGRAQLSSLRHAQSFVPGLNIHVFTMEDSDNLNWLSPEVVAQDADGYDEKSDIYSIGMTILELINGCPPYSDVSPTYMLVEKLRGAIPAFARDDVSTALNQVAAACTLQDPQLRPSAQQLLSLPFFKMKGDLRTLLHPVIPMSPSQIQTNCDDMRVILASSNKMAQISIDNIDWSFD